MRPVGWAIEKAIHRILEDNDLAVHAAFLQRHQQLLYWN